MKPHKHAELIKAWADGAEIEWVYATEGDGTKLWVVVDNPAWNESHEYRIKHEPKPCNGFCGEQECKENQKNCERARMARKLLGSGTPQTKPLSDEKINELFHHYAENIYSGGRCLTYYNAFARAIEKEHGIK